MRRRPARSLQPNWLHNRRRCKHGLDSDRFPWTHPKSNDWWRHPLG
ncbi:hypothetical protein [Lysobacter gummosus]